MLRSYEVLAEPTVDVLVNAAHPDARAYTIDGVSLPDFEAFTGSAVRAAFVCNHYIVRRDDLGMGMIANIRPDQIGLPEEPERMSTIKSWALESIDALQYPVPDEGLPVKFFLFYLDGPVDSLQADSSAWHIDMDDGALTVFEVDPTETLDEDFQNAYQLEEHNEPVIFKDDELAQRVGQSVEGHSKRPKSFQTLYIGRRNIHRQPPLIEGQMRRGVICFLNSEL